MGGGREKIIQIAGNGSQLFALTDKGNMFILVSSDNSTWTKVGLPTFNEKITPRK